MKLYGLILFLIVLPCYVFSQQANTSDLLLKSADSLIRTLKEYKELAKEGNDVQIIQRITDSMKDVSNGPIKNLVRYELGIFDGIPCGWVPTYYAYYSIRDGKFVLISKEPIDDYSHF